MMVIYEYDPNAILVEPLPYISKKSIVQSYQKSFQYLTKRGLKPILQILDNEASKLIQDNIDKIKYNGN